MEILRYVQFSIAQKHLEVSGMKTVKRKMLNYLIQKNDWIEARELANVFSVTPRTVSSYVKELNQLYQQPLILSSYKGYRWNCEMKQFIDEYEEKEESATQRIPRIIMKLIAHANTNLFDLADELYISDSLLSMDLRKVAQEVKKYGLKFKREKNILTIEGSEEDKRKAIAALLREESLPNLSNLFQGSQFQTDYLSSDNVSMKLLQPLNDVLRQEQNIHFNDFGIHNILIHILVMSDRILANRVLPENKSMDALQKSDEYQLAIKLKSILEATLNIQVPGSELNYLTLVISSNAVLLNPFIVCDANINDYIPESFVLLGKSLVKSLETNYFLSPFSNDFTLKFTIHIMNLVTRSKLGITLRNVYADKTKEDYPLIYDMALYIVKQLSKKCQIKISHDEITYLVYHIGSYLLMKQNEDKINVCIVYLNYNDFHMNALSVMKLRYETVIDFTITPLFDFAHMQQDMDFMITLGNFPLNTKKLVIPFHLIPTAKDFNVLDGIVKQIGIERRRTKLKNSLAHFIKKELFDFEIYAENEYKLIEIMTNRCMALHLCGSDFQKGVIEREQLSSTAILNGIAVPHSLEHVCKTSFLYFVINSNNTKWGDQMVRVIIMIGTSIDDSDSFKELFDNLIKVLYDPRSLPKFLKIHDYDEFINTLVELILSHAEQ